MGFGDFVNNFMRGFTFGMFASNPFSGCMCSPFSGGFYNYNRVDFETFANPFPSIASIWNIKYPCSQSYNLPPLTFNNSYNQTLPSFNFNYIPTPNYSIWDNYIPNQPYYSDFYYQPLYSFKKDEEKKPEKEIPKVEEKKIEEKKIEEKKVEKKEEKLSTKKSNIKINGKSIVSEEIESGIYINKGDYVNLKNTKPYMKDALIKLDKKAEELGYTMVVVDGYRSHECQAAARKRKGSIVAPAGKSAHEYGVAVDLALYDKNGKQINIAKVPAFGEFAESIGLEWGQRWGKTQTKEPWHFNFNDWRDLADVKDEYKKWNNIA